MNKTLYYIIIILFIGWVSYRTGLYVANRTLLHSMVTSMNYDKGGFAFYTPLSIYSNSTDIKLYGDYLIGREMKNQEYNLEGMFYCRQITDNGIQSLEVQNGKGSDVRIGNDEFRDGEKI